GLDRRRRGPSDRPRQCARDAAAQGFRGGGAVSGDENDTVVRPQRLRLTALGVGLVGAGLLAAALWSIAGQAKAASSAGAPARGAQFSAYIDDLPIMPGLAENDEGYAFDLFQG